MVRPYWKVLPIIDYCSREWHSHCEWLYEIEYIQKTLAVNSFVGRKQDILQAIDFNRIINGFSKKRKFTGWF